MWFDVDFNGIFSTLWPLFEAKKYVLMELKTCDVWIKRTTICLKGVSVDLVVTDYLSSLNSDDFDAVCLFEQKIRE